MNIGLMSAEYPQTLRFLHGLFTEETPPPPPLCHNPLSPPCSCFPFPYSSPLSFPFPLLDFPSAAPSLPLVSRSPTLYGIALTGASAYHHLYDHRV